MSQKSSYDYDVAWFLEGLLFIITFVAWVLGLAQAYNVWVSTRGNIFEPLYPAIILLAMSFIAYMKNDKVY